MEAVEKQLKEKASHLLKEGELELFIGYCESPEGHVSPLLVREPQQVDLLVWNERCVHNLTTYLVRDPAKAIMRSGKKVGLVVKGCDARSLIELVRENQLQRESIFALGVVCGGVRDLRTGEICKKCIQCQWQYPPLVDLVIGDEEKVKPIEGDPLEEINAILRMPVNQRWEYWKRQFEKCIKCYACRQVCPMCYCEECITERTRPQWIDKSTTLRGVLSYHLVRALHLAGRCIGCSECRRACPFDIPVDLLTRFVTLRAEEAFNFKPGTNPEAKPLFADFSDSDPEGFVK